MIGDDGDAVQKLHHGDDAFHRLDLGVVPAFRRGRRMAKTPEAVRALLDRVWLVEGRLPPGIGISSPRCSCRVGPPLRARRRSARPASRRR